MQVFCSWEQIFSWLENTLSRMAGLLANSRWRPWRHFFIRWFIGHYGVDLSEAVLSDYRDYTSFNDFFTRRLKEGARPVALSGIISPVDGVVSACGTIDKDTIFQAKGHDYLLGDLLANFPFSKRFESGAFLTAYLSPKDYHRVHLPFSGRLLSMHYVPGRLFSVNTQSVLKNDALFARNERVILYFETPVGPMAVILVGALLVASVTITGHGVVAPGSPRRIRSWDYAQAPTMKEAGAELGYFTMGSTAIVLFGPKAVSWSSNLRSGAPLRMGEVIGVTHSSMQS